jgi:predicted nucleotide-binding protein (sugar kinase/HSP70/actin superfamily)
LTQTARSVGIPQSLLYYKYFPMWRAFFETLGFTVVTSAPTTQATVRSGTGLGENELCLPVKVYFGHCAELDGTVDYLFVPRIVSVDAREFTCPKFLGLPDMTKVHGFRTPMLSPTFDLRKGRVRWLREFYRFGRFLGGGRVASWRAVRAGLRAETAHEAALHAGTCMRAPVREEARIGRPLRIGVAGHPYNIYDPHISQNLIRRLTEQGIAVVTSDMVSLAEVDAAVEDLPKALFWSYEKEVVGAVEHWLRGDAVDGMIYVLSFACGPDSLIQTIIEDAVRRMPDGRRVPLLCLVIDEHSGEAGFVTRIEAFVDMLRMRDAEVGSRDDEFEAEAAHVLEAGRGFATDPAAPAPARAPDDLAPEPEPAVL